MNGLALGIDTAGPTVGIALWSGSEAQAIVHRSARLVRGADGWVGPQIAEILQMVDDPDGPCQGESLDRVAVTTGPGAFTGLRVGVSLALGVAVARQLPIYGLSALQVRAALHRGPRVLALLDARKGRVYGGFFNCSGEVPVPGGPEADVDVSFFLREPGVWATGEGAEVRRDEIEAAQGRILPEPCASPAAALARLSLHQTGPGSAEALQLRYIRLPDAKKPSDKGRSG